MQKRLLTILMLAFSSAAVAQTPANFGEGRMLYDASMTFESKALGKSINVSLHLPEEWYLTEEVDYPVLVLFDSQHTQTYPFLLHSIDLLISNAQLPHMIVVGIPFENEERRAMTTVHQKAGATAAFLTEELMPYLKANYKAQELAVVAGHSRTGFFTSYLVAEHADHFNAAISLSAFFENGFMPEDLRGVMQQLEQLGRPFHWYFAAGTSIEEQSYLEDQHLLRDSLDMIYQRRPQTICKLREIDHTNHMSTYMQGLQWALTEYFSGYERILDEWLFEKGETIAADKAVVAFASDFRQLSDRLGHSVHPSIIHFWSIASMFYHRGDKEVYLSFLELASRVFPKEYSFPEEIGMEALKNGDRERAAQYLNTALVLLEKYPFLNKEERKQMQVKIQQALAK